ncbi:hypothetical protein AB0395_45680 [Streptosporangium sp. NPDC051023]|uniref:hypothetical protein n=1 Tax=Streptosporangium sp. NPDC051023 TaxID=3155410 RepID=UPI00344C834E
MTHHQPHGPTCLACDPAQRATWLAAQRARADIHDAKAEMLRQAGKPADADVHIRQAAILRRGADRVEAAHHPAAPTEPFTGPIRRAQLWARRAELSRRFIVTDVTDDAARGMDYQTDKSWTRTATLPLDELRANYQLLEDFPAHLERRSA